MNYLRGAVNAISAPYQYYKDINPSTLTGAIDVIVVRRPKDLPEHPLYDGLRQLTDEETELVCSPFHVRFGKWQVLRPQDKKVDVYVNGQPVPFSMKIGEAGEAFFVFETEEEIPDSLVTSPILQATKPGEVNAHPEGTGRFGAGTDVKDSAASSQEPDFLDLDAQPEGDSGSPSSSRQTLDGDSDGPSLIARTAEVGKAMMGVARETRNTETDKLRDQSIIDGMKHAAGIRFPGMRSDDGDEFLPNLNQVHEPEVRYTHDVVFDMEGYHSTSHGRDASDMTIRSGSSRPQDSSPSGSSADRTPGPSSEQLRLGTPSPPATSSMVPFPRATSEPPPDFDEYDAVSSSRHAASTSVTRTPSAADRAHLPSLSSLQASDTEEYTWDWGNFPQKTPIRTTFGPTGHFPGTSMDLSARKSKGRTMSETPDAHHARTRVAASSLRGAVEEEDVNSYGVGGRLTVDKRDPTRYRVFIEGRTVEFELAVAGPEPSQQESDERNVHGGPLGGEDEVSDELRFEKSKIDFHQFLLDDTVIADPNLVLRWAGDQYIRRQDGSPLMDALVTWRESALRDKQPLISSRPGSPQPLSEDESVKSDGDEPRNRRAKPTPTGKMLNNETVTRTPTSSSWVRWWSRSRRAEGTRPELSHASSEPSGDYQELKAEQAKGTSVHRTATSASAPPLPILVSTNASKTSLGTTHLEQPKRFAKTLRLTSDQLKSLNLKHGANSITFSISSTGVAACTARLFVWDHTDHVVVSDIDGTITKSDALGHVFTMIGRDWTHVGVAKLYTDICRNGYKIMYLTSRAIGQADSTRDYLKGIKQNDYQLPEGPVIMSPDRLMASLHREVIMRKPEVFKMACLRDIQKLFGGPNHNPFYAGFGNRITDALSYRSVNIPSSRIFTIDSTGEVKMELLELAGYKSSYIHMTDLVDQMFPPVNRKFVSEFTDFNYWKPPMQDFPLPDLSPPSPALSARSDTSNQSTLARLRNFSLVGPRQPTRSFALPPPATEATGTLQENEARLRQMSSLERLSNTLATFAGSSSSSVGSPRSSSPTLHDSEDSDYEGDDDLEKARRRRERRRSVASMPGSLPGSNPGSDDEIEFGDEDDEDDHDGYEGENEEDVPDEAFDEALDAAGEMQNVDYI
ncbi:LNS2-domain-containing protein [Epithele typhae]|uniref:LNS2-domain-containing protein n=1 Tax=Epithele typhae TaxID=378194 RepID=UPI002008704D|nr:LNS2-domain-containing protein [Epithele typhae]KAH9943217.1 LNS2-domain-containing protein [Epithele typhae]